MNCGLVVLAAGASVRLGQPKQLMPYKGTSLLKHAVSEAMRSDAKPVIVVLGANADLISKEIRDENVHIVNNTGWEEGMASSVRVGLDKLLEISSSAEAAILMPCDQPYVSASLLNELINTHIKTGKQIVASDYGDAIGPPALFLKNIFPELMKLRGDAGARKIVQQYGDEVATVFFSRGKVDIDTKEDYEALKILSSN